jgi:hypothetical protein
MCSCGGLLFEEGIQHVPAPGVCERMGGGLLDSPRFVAVERALVALTETVEKGLADLREKCTNLDENLSDVAWQRALPEVCNIADKVDRTHASMLALAERVTSLGRALAAYDLRADSLGGRVDYLSERVARLESFHDPDAGHLRDTPVSDAVTRLAERVAKLEQAEARREKLAEIRADRLARTGEGIYVPPPMDARDWDPITCQPIAGDFNGPHGPEPARPSERERERVRVYDNGNGLRVAIREGDAERIYTAKEAMRLAEEIISKLSDRPSEADVAYVRAEVDRDHYRDRVFRAEATLARLRAWAEELYFGQHDDEHRRCGKVVRHVLAILDGADAKGGG